LIDIRDLLFFAARAAPLRANVSIGYQSRGGRPTIAADATAVVCYDARP
jgi:hypothetical protein